MALSTGGIGSQGGIRLRRAGATVVGRSIELGALEEAIEAARDGIAGVSLEGEPGIGKSRLLLAAADVARAHGFLPVTVSADEELRGPFLLARSLLSSQALRDGASDRVVAALDRACDVVAGRDDSGFGGLSPDERLLRVIDQASLALRTAALERPIALLLDDLQWADQDSLRLLRYIVRTQPSLQLFVAIALRPEESAQTPELLTLLADMDRMGIVRRLRVNRFRTAETGDLLRQTMAGDVAAQTISTVHGQAEGVPFVIEELARAYRDAGLLQMVDGSWTLAPKAARLVPSSVRTLVQRRAAGLREDTKSVLADAAVLGRTFRAGDVCAIRAQLGQPECTPAAVAELLEPAIAAGLLGSRGEGGADYSFSHEQVHDFAAGLLAPARRRAIHAAIVDLMAADEQATPTTQAILARHALAAGDTDRAARYSVAASRAALQSSAPEEALRLVDDALGVVAAIGPRVALLQTRDDALEMLRRVGDRLEGLTELAALAEASGDRGLAAEVMLRRAAALRLDGQRDAAATLARDVRRMAAERGDRERELAACIELGQLLLGAALGEGYAPTPLEADFDGAEEAYRRAAEIAEQLNDRPRLAAITRELGVITVARGRAWFIDAYRRGEHIDILRHVAAGGSLNEKLLALPVASLVHQAVATFHRALELYEELGDRRGAMSTVIAMAYIAWAGDVHLGGTPAHRIEEIRRLATRLQSLTKESDRAAAEVQMVFGVHVFCRAKVIPDLALLRAREALEQARILGDRGLEFQAAIGAAGMSLELGDAQGAKQYVDRAAAIAAETPTSTRVRQLEVVRGLLASAAGDLDRLGRHMVQALDSTLRQDRRAARCEILATYALECARLSEADAPDGLLREAEARAEEARRLAAELPGHAPWAAQAEAVIAAVAFRRGDSARALEHARRALAGRREADREEPHLEILLPAARVILAAGTPDEAAAIREELQLVQALIGQRTMDSEIRAQWFRGPVGSRLSALAGPYVPVAGRRAGDAAASDAGPGADGPSPRERRLLTLLVEGRTNAEIAAELDMAVEAVGQALAGMYARIGASSRADATVMALSGVV